MSEYQNMLLAIEIEKMDYVFGVDDTSRFDEESEIVNAKT
jgi:hypothetical protein